MQLLRTTMRFLRECALAAFALGALLFALVCFLFLVPRPVQIGVHAGAVVVGVWYLICRMNRRKETGSQQEPSDDA